MTERRINMTELRSWKHGDTYCGTALEAIEFALTQNLEANTFLQAWTRGDLNEWPDFKFKRVPKRVTGELASILERLAWFESLFTFESGQAANFAPNIPLTADKVVVLRSHFDALSKRKSEKTLRELQTSLPWTGHYHRDFRSTPMTHKDFAHALLHIHKAGGKLAAIVNDAEHGGVDWADANVRKDVSKYVADFVVCALRMANTCPEGVFDLQAAVEDRITMKNNQLASEASTMEKAEHV